MSRSRPSPTSACTRKPAKSPWTSQELYICARLLEDIHAYPESARYYFALYNSKGMPDAQETAIAGLTSLLLTAPETPIRLGSGELSMYRDIATMDQGPGYLNGILSLILNTTAAGVAVFRGRTARRAVLPSLARRRIAGAAGFKVPELPHVVPSCTRKLLEFYSNSGESDAVIQGGREFLANFPESPRAYRCRIAHGGRLRAQGRHSQANSRSTIPSCRNSPLKRKTCPLGSAEAASTPLPTTARRPRTQRTRPTRKMKKAAKSQTGETETERRSSPRGGESFQLGATASSSRQPARVRPNMRACSSAIWPSGGNETDSSCARSAAPRDRSQSR